MSEELRKDIEIIERTCEMFDAPLMVDNINIGPRVIQYCCIPMPLNGRPTKFSKIQALGDDLQLALKAKSIRIEKVASVGAVGIEVPRDDPEIVRLKDIARGLTGLQIAIGRDVGGNTIIADIAQMPHAIVAGSTGAGKSVFLNTVISTLAMNNSPEELQMVLIDPKRVELAAYTGLPHLHCPIIVDADKAVGILEYMVREMERRNVVLQEAGKRNIVVYNETATEKMPYQIIFIDEFADLIMTNEAVETSVVRIAQMGRSAGIHIFICTQRPTVNILSGLIKANVSTRVAFMTSSQIDSRVIIDQNGCESLLGNGDALFFDNAGITRVQAPFITDEEINNIVEFRKRKHNKRKGRNG